MVKPKRLGVLFLAEHSSCGNPHLAVACRFSGDSARCAPWSLIVVSDLIPEHLYLPSSTLAVSAHLHVHGREAPRSTGRTGQWKTERLVELKLVTVDCGRATSRNSSGRDPSSSPLAAPPSCQKNRLPQPTPAISLPCARESLPRRPPEERRRVRPGSVLHGVRSAVTGGGGRQLSEQPSRATCLSLGPLHPSSLRGVRPCSPRSLRDQCTLWVDKDGSLRHGLCSSLRVFFVECAVLCG